MRRLGRAAAVLTAALIGGVAAADDARPVVVVYDASGSMWGQIDGVAKVDIARGAATGLLSAWPAARPIGLVAYGHRTAGRCDDIETVRTPEAGAAEAVAAAIAGLRPTGKTPLADAITQGAEALGPGGGAVVVLTDGVETCNPDPCAAVRALAAATAELVVHVVGFDVAATADVAQLTCIAKAGRGRFVAAADAGDLLSGLAAVVETAAPPVEDAAPAPLPVNLKIDTRLGDGTPAPADEVYHYIYALGEDGRSETGLDVGSSEVEFGLPPGAYEIVTRFRAVDVTSRGEVAADTLTEHVVTIEAVDVAVETRLAGGIAVSDPRAVYHFWARQDADGAFVEARGIGSSQKQASITPGIYKLTTKYRGLTHVQDVVFDGATTVRVELPGAEIEIAGVTAAGAAVPENTYYLFYSAEDPAAAADISTIGSSTRAFASRFGTYAVESRYSGPGGEVRRTHEIVVAPDGPRRFTLPLD